MSCYNYVYVHVCTCLAPPLDLAIRTDTSAQVLVEWRPALAMNHPRPDSYDIEITYTDNMDISHITVIPVPGTATEVEYNQLIPQQQYTCCVIAVYGSLTSRSCGFFETSNSNSTQLVLVGGVLGFVIAVLVLLLVVAGVGMAYLQCVRSRGKDNSR